MSRSNPTEGSKNPCTRWFEWAGGDEGGHARYYDKDAKIQVKVPLPFTFLLLDELSTIRGWHDASDSGIYANEVRDTRQDALVVRSFKGGELASGIYKAIQDRVKAQGGHYCASLYLAYRDGEALRIGNLSLKGAATGAWMGFKKTAPTVKDPDGKSIKAYYAQAVKIESFEQLKKGATIYRVPKFTLVPVADATNDQADILDVELQAFFTDYFQRPKAEAAKPAPDEHFESSDNDPDPPPMTGKLQWQDIEDDIPF